MKRFAYLLILALIGIVVAQIQPSFSGESQKDTKLIGTWTTMECSTDTSGNPCPFLPDSMEFFNDQTMTMSNLGTQHFPYKTTLTKDEKLVIEKRNPYFKGKSLLLIKNNPNINWDSTRMTYVYSVDKDELTLTLQGWSPGKFSRKAK
jgi:hypothetical protein